VSFVLSVLWWLSFQLNGIPFGFWVYLFFPVIFFPRISPFCCLEGLFGSPFSFFQTLSFPPDSEVLGPFDSLGTVIFLCPPVTGLVFFMQLPCVSKRLLSLVSPFRDGTRFLFVGRWESLSGSRSGDPGPAALLVAPSESLERPF